MLGACDFNFKLLNIHNVCNNIYYPNINSKMLYGAHANYYSLNGAKYIFKKKCKNLSFFDKNYNDIFDYFKYTSCICYPNLVVSDITTTNLHHEYILLSNIEKNYYINCFDNFNFNDYNFIYLDLIIKNKNYNFQHNETYEYYISILINNYFNKNYERCELKKRLVMDFFTMEDIYFIKNFQIMQNL